MINYYSVIFIYICFFLFATIFFQPIINLINEIGYKWAYYIVDMNKKINKKKNKKK